MFFQRKMSKKNSKEVQSKKNDFEQHGNKIFEKPHCSTNIGISNNKEDSTFIGIFNNKQDIIVLNQNNKMEVISFTSDEILESVQFEDSTVEVVGLIDEIDGPKIEPKAQDCVLKFILNNNSRHRIEVLIGDTEIERVRHHIEPNRIIHIDGAKAIKPKTSEPNRGTSSYVLYILSNTIINNLGIFDLKKIINDVQPKLIDLSNIPDYKSCVLVRGYIKTNFFSNLSKMFGSITDGCYKLEIQISECEHGIKFEKGQQVELKGYLKIKNDVFHLDVEKISDVKILGNQTLSLAQLLQGAKPIMKRTLPDDVDSPSKRYKYN